jgi:hypothetical protein
MRGPLSPDQRRRVEELVREKEERCGLCGSTGLRCDEDAATFVGGGFNVRVLCANTGAEAPGVGLGLARDYSVTPDEARRVGLGEGPSTGAPSLP